MTRLAEPFIALLASLVPGRHPKRHDAGRLKSILKARRNAGGLVPFWCSGHLGKLIETARHAIS
jgi:hypothetical protein